MCLVVVFVVFIHAYQLKPQWKGYDDIFRGRTNAAGVTIQASESLASGIASQAFPKLGNNNLHSTCEVISLPAGPETSESGQPPWYS
ncbi:G-protein coupled receptor 98 [Cricetulus griseus]|uniref:G-protein coupled receptor 98 n=1 Tax=Cricetulus griseus TaxID=10029 RepID=G3HZB4_CRIGR|nr:G-protein coupled receptor 98 [Cricetulus griseus]